MGRWPMRRRNSADITGLGSSDLSPCRSDNWPFWVSYLKGTALCHSCIPCYQWVEDSRYPSARPSRSLTTEYQPMSRDALLPIKANSL